MHKRIREFLTDDCGATAFEYAVIASMASIAIIVGATQIGTRLSTDYFWKIVSYF
jgi:Flp pilus assembly pilin Flp